MLGKAAWCFKCRTALEQLGQRTAAHWRHNRRQLGRQQLVRPAQQAQELLTSVPRAPLSSLVPLPVLALPPPLKFICMKKHQESTGWEVVCSQLSSCPATTPAAQAGTFAATEAGRARHAVGGSATHPRFRPTAQCPAAPHAAASTTCQHAPCSAAAPPHPASPPGARGGEPPASVTGPAQGRGGQADTRVSGS